MVRPNFRKPGHCDATATRAFCGAGSQPASESGTERACNVFVGTGVMEAGCKTVIGCRLKQCGMFWTVRGANAIALRCCWLSGRFEDYWEARRA